MSTTPIAKHHEHRSVSGGQARAAVFGASDGLVSNISLILGFAGSGAESSVVRLAGVAGLLAGAMSMAAGEWVSVTAQNELIQRELDIERRELARHPEAETAELTRLYQSRGVPADSAREVAEALMRRPDDALSVHAQEELGVKPGSLNTPWIVAAFSFACFAVGAILPVLPWFVTSGRAATVASVGLGVIAAAVIGALIARLAARNLAKGALRQVLILLLACGVTYLVGKAIGVNVT